MKTILCLFLLSCTSLFASSLRLINDSPYRLRAVIRGNDGSYLGEMILNTEHASTWNDTSGQVGYFGKGNVYQEQSTRSQTPYTVLWYCMQGEETNYSVCNMVATGSTITAQNCLGARQCKPPKKKPGAQANSPQEGEFLHKEEQHEESAVGPPAY